MLAFEVEVDGEPFARAGVEDWAVLSLIVTAGRGRRPGTRGEPHLSLHLGGLTLPDSEGVSHHVRWGEPENILAIGSQITLRVIDNEAIDPPRRRHRSDREVQEPLYTEEEERELRHRDYLELKKEFEPDRAG